MRKTFHISKKPIIAIAEREKSKDSREDLQPPRSHGLPRLVAIARDPWTIFAYWSVDWTSVFQTVSPVDRQVHLRTHCEDGLKEKEEAIEPMAGMHYIKILERHRSCRIEIGYYQPADVWHSVAMSNELAMPVTESAEVEDLDIATIPFHLSFQRLAEALGATNNDALANAISRLQANAVNKSYEKLPSEEREILRRTGVTSFELTEARRALSSIDAEKVRTRAQAALRGPTSQARGFRGDWASGGS